MKTLSDFISRFCEFYDPAPVPVPVDATVLSVEQLMEQLTLLGIHDADNSELIVALEAKGFKAVPVGPMHGFVYCFYLMLKADAAKNYPSRLLTDDIV